MTPRVHCWRVWPWRVLLVSSGSWETLLSMSLSSFLPLLFLSNIVLLPFFLCLYREEEAAAQFLFFLFLGGFLFWSLL